MGPTSERRYRFGPLERRATLGPLRDDQLLVLGSASLMGLVFVFATQSAIGVLAALILIGMAALSIFVPFEGRTPAEWVPVALRFGLSRRRGPYRSDAPGVGFRVGGDEDRKASLPPELEGVELLSFTYGGEEVGVTCERWAGTYTVAIAVRTDAIALRDASEQKRALESWGGVLASCARGNSAVDGCSGSSGPYPGRETSSPPTCRRSATGPCSSGRRRLLLSRTDRGSGAHHPGARRPGLRPDRRAADLKPLGGGDGAACELLVLEAECVARRLGSAEIKVFGLLRSRQYAEVIRDAFDPFGHQARARSRLGGPGREGVDPELIIGSALALGLPRSPDTTASRR